MSNRALTRPSSTASRNRWHSSVRSSFASACRTTFVSSRPSVAPYCTKDLFGRFRLGRLAILFPIDRPFDSVLLPQLPDAALRHDRHLQLTRPNDPDRQRVARRGPGRLPHPPQKRHLSARLYFAELQPF